MARTLEECGVEAVWTFGTAVLVAPVHSPVVLAKRAATIDVQSGGRLLLGLGHRLAARGVRGGRRAAAEAGRPADAVEITAWPGSCDPARELDPAFVREYAAAGASRLVTAPQRPGRAARSGRPAEPAWPGRAARADRPLPRRGPGQAVTGVNVLDTVVLPLAEADGRLARRRSDYLPGARDRGLTPERSHRGSGSLGVHILWSLPTPHAFHVMRGRARPDPKVAGFWTATNTLASCRGREVLEPAGGGA